MTSVFSRQSELFYERGFRGEKGGVDGRRAAEFEAEVVADELDVGLEFAALVVAFQGVGFEVFQVDRVVGGRGIAENGVEVPLWLRVAVGGAYVAVSC